MEAVFNILSLRQTFLLEVIPEVEYTRKIAMSISDILIDALAQILTEIYQFKNLTYFVTWWRYHWRHEYVFT